jgi:hypothetical protein
MRCIESVFYFLVDSSCLPNKRQLTDFEKYARLQLIMMGLLCLQKETTLREDVLENRQRRDVMGDKGGKKDKEKGQKQNTEKQKQKSKNKIDKQPKRKP